MGKMNAGLAAYLQKKKMGFVQAKANANPTAPMIPMHPQMVSAIKKSPAGVLPPGLLKYLASKKAIKKGGK